MEVLVGFSWMVLGSIFFLFLAAKWNGIRYKGKGLPPGTMGWPFLGQTFEFIKQGPKFMKKQRERYGSVFKSHILGSPTVISMDPELNRYILLNESKGLIPGYPQSMLDVLGHLNIAAVSGTAHKHMRSNMLSLVGTPLIKDRLLPRLDKYMRIHVSNWDGLVVDIQEKTMDMALMIAFKQIAEAESSSIYEDFKSEFEKLLAGSLSLPIYFPGTKYYQGIQGRKNVIKMLIDLMEKRWDSKVVYDDILEYLLRDMDAKLNHDEVIDQIITILYSGYETVSTTSMMAVKYLHDHPQALQELRDEHFEIRKRKTSAEEPLDWEDIKSMKFTRAVIYETLRLATVINGVLRKTTKDMTLNGFIIPKGWRIYVYTREINYDPFLYPEPFEFNPWRWMDKSLEAHNYCFLFGGGGRLCPGKELGIVKVSTFLHYFVTTYRWKEIGGEKILQFPRVEAPNGYHIWPMLCHATNPEPRHPQCSRKWKQTSENTNPPYYRNNSENSSVITQINNLTGFHLHSSSITTTSCSSSFNSDSVWLCPVKWVYFAF